MGESTVVADGWGWRFGANPSTSVDGVSFTIDAGERVLLLGPSGSGKSTLLRGIAGLLAPDEGASSGALTVLGHDAREQRGDVGIVFQDPETQAVLHRIGDDVAFGLENQGTPADQIWPRVTESLELVGLDFDLAHSTSALSGGQKQRLALAGAMAREPRILLLDEPTANLDTAGAALVRASVEQVASATNASVIVVEHRLDLWWTFATRVIVLDARGCVLADGSPAAVLKNSRAELAASGIWLPDHTPTPVPVASDTRIPIRSSVALLEAQHVSIRRPGGAIVLDQFNLNVTAGELLAITGANGVGKSTLGLTLGGLIPIAGGDLRATEPLARGVGQAPYRWTSRQLHTRIGTVFQSPAHQFVRPTVRAELQLSASTAGLRGRPNDTAVSEMLERLNLTGQASANPFTLSGGQQRRLSVATALIARPSVLILDEPTFGQDAHTWQQLLELMHELAGQGRAIVALTHDDKLVANADRRIELGMS